MGSRALPNLFDETIRANDLYEMELIGDRRFLAAVPICADVEIKKRILGAIKSVLGDIKSVDYTIKRYGNRWTFSDPTEVQRFVVESLRSIDRRAELVGDAIINANSRPEGIGFAAGEAALVRLKSSFRSALILLSQAHSFEASAVIRLTLEQLAWSYAIRSYRSEASIARLQPTKAIQSLKELAPFAGRLYGVLTKHAHIDPTITSLYHRASADGDVEIRYQLNAESLVAIGHLLGVLNVFQSVTAALFGSNVFAREENGAFSRLENRSKELSEALKTLKSNHNDLSWIPDLSFAI